ncbi:MAG: sigma-70 family RNA polymerase sigma factor [Halieaceae bacterium]|uniref:RNA polymerase sigma factor n=1 Tax=Haliea alexandrii TaxID=2448162 RepID=UPI0018EE4DA3|nr:sigma-70 family RNA polymerase sigma factor [Haliea alexandrii]MCR9184323.1 sigma-70 family RNA polymerase sigma factor [Halieaceae bacterium]
MSITPWPVGLQGDKLVAKSMDGGASKAAGDEYFASLVRDHHRALIGLAAPIVGASEAEEVVQNAWLKAYRAIDGFEGRSAIRTWLSRIVINEARMQLRSRKREVFLEDQAGDSGASDPLNDRFLEDGHWKVPPVTWSMDSPEGLLMSVDLMDCLERLLQRMSSNQRAVLEMRDSNELPFDDICNTLEISASNARVLLHRARAELFKLVDHYEETGEC